MAESKDKRYCVIDHANKRGERQRLNPNRASIRAARHQGVLPADLGGGRPALQQQDRDDSEN